MTIAQAKYGLLVYIYCIWDFMYALACFFFLSATTTQQSVHTTCVCALYMFPFHTTCIMKGTKVQTLGARAVAGAWCMAG